MGTLAGSFFVLGSLAFGLRGMAPLALLVGGVWLIQSVPSLVGSLNLLQWKQWARILILIVSGPMLIVFPGGTLIGAYTLWALNRKDVKQLYQHPPAPALPSPMLADDPQKDYPIQSP